MGNNISKMISILTIIPFIIKWYYLLFKNNQVKKKQKNIVSQNEFVEWGQFLEIEELDNCNRDKMI